MYERKKDTDHKTRIMLVIFSYLGNDLKMFYKHGGYISTVAYTRDMICCRPSSPICQFTCLTYK